MERSSICTCGKLQRQARDPDSPITYDKSSAGYMLHLSAEQSIEIQACSLCGGYDTVQQEGRLCFYTGGTDCSCNCLSKWASDPFLAVQYDEPMGEYVIEGVGILYYCMACGGRLPESKRGDFFSKPSSEEIEEVRKALEGISRVDEVDARLGPPDRITEWEESPEDLFRCEKWDRSLSYLKRWKTLNLIIFEKSDKINSYAISGKYLGK